MPVPFKRSSGQDHTTPMTFQDISQLVIGGDKEVKGLPLTLFELSIDINVTPIDKTRSLEVLLDFDDDNFIEVSKRVFEEYLYDNFPVITTDGNGVEIDRQTPPVMEALFNKDMLKEVFLNKLYDKFDIDVPEESLLDTFSLLGSELLGDDVRDRITQVGLFGFAMAQYRRLADSDIVDTLMDHWPGLKPLVLSELTDHLSTLEDSFATKALKAVLSKLDDGAGSGDINVYQNMAASYNSQGSASDEIADDFCSFAEQLYRIVPDDIKDKVERVLVETDNEDIQAIFKRYSSYDNTTDVVKDLLKKGANYLKAESLIKVSIDEQTLTGRWPLLKLTAFPSL